MNNHRMNKNIPPPPERIHVRRLDDTLKSIKPGFSVLVDAETARCLVNYGRYNKWRMTQRAEGSKVRVWRLEEK